MSGNESSEWSDWEAHADWWQAEFTDGVDPEYEEQILPLAVQLMSGFDRVLDLGTGEGQVARRLSSVDAQSTTPVVIGVDPTRSQIDEAVARGGSPSYGVASGDALPFRDGSFDAAIACLVFEHIDDIDTPILEVARLIRPGGRFALFLNHPILQTPGSGWIDDHMVDPPELYWRLGPYLVESSQVEEVHKDVFIRFVHRPLSRYVNALTRHGLSIVEMHEPSPPPGFVAKSASFAAAAAFPRLLVLVCERLS